MQEFQYIRHLTESGDWEYSNVKSVGVLSELTTTNKDDIVSAINEINRYFSIDLEAVKDLLEGLRNIEDTIENMGDLVALEKEKIEKIAKDMDAKKVELEQRMTNTELKLSKKITSSETDIANLKKRASTIEKNLSEKGKEIDGKIVAIEKEIVETNEELSSKLSKSEYDDNVGIDKWIASFHPITSNHEYPKVEHLLEESPNYVEEHDDSVIFYPFLEDKFGILHLFTNVYVKNGKTFGITLTHDNSTSVLMNGAYIYYKQGNGAGNISFSLRDGWNTIEVLMFQNGVGSVKSNVKISDLVEKMTTTIGVGNKNESRMTHNETMLKQTNDLIALKADKTVVSELGNKIEHFSAELSVQAEKISSKVEKSEHNEYTKRLVNAETTIEQTSEKIESLATKKEVDELNGIVTVNTTKISQLAGDIELMASDETLDELNERVEKAEASIKINSESIVNKVESTVFDKEVQKITEHATTIEQLKDQIKLKAGRTELDTVTGKIGSIESELSVQAGVIESKASKTEVDSVKKRVDSAETNIIQNTNDILLKASASVVDTLNLKVNKVEAEQLIQAGLIESKVSFEEFDGLGNTVSNALTRIAQTEKDIKLTVSKDEFDTMGERLETAEAEISINKDAIKSMVTKTDFDTISKKVNTATTTIEQTAKDIALLASKESVDAITGDISKMKTDISVNAEEIKSMVTSEQFDAVSNKVDSMTTGIQQNAKDILLKASKTSVDNITGEIDKMQADISLNAQEILSRVGKKDYEKDYSSIKQRATDLELKVVDENNIISKINLSKEKVQIEASKVEIKGVVTFESLTQDVRKVIEQDASKSTTIIGGIKSVSDSALTLADKANGLVDTWVYTDKTTIDGAMIRTGTVTADSIRAGTIDGHTIVGATFKTSKTVSEKTDGNGLIMNSSGLHGYDSSGVRKTRITNQGVLEAEDAIIRGTLHAGGDSTFGGNITTEKDVRIGNQLYLQTPYDNRFTEKGIHFGTSDGNDGFTSKIEGTYLKIRIINDNIVTIDSPTFDVTGGSRFSKPVNINYVHDTDYGLVLNNSRAWFKKGAVFSGGVVDFTGATVKGIVPVFG